MSAECHTSFQTGCQHVLGRQTLCAPWAVAHLWMYCAGAQLCQIHMDVRRALCDLYVCVCLGACVYTSEHKPYPERDKSNPLPGGAQGSSIDGTLSGCWWTSLSDKVYHSDLSQRKTPSGISKHRGNWRPKNLLEGTQACLYYWMYVHNTFVFINDFSHTSNLKGFK